MNKSVCFAREKMKNLYDSITEHFPEFDFEKRDFVWADFFTAGDFAQFITQKIRENEPIEKYLHFIEDLLFEAGDDDEWIYFVKENVLPLMSRKIKKALKEVEK